MSIIRKITSFAMSVILAVSLAPALPFQAYAADDDAPSTDTAIRDVDEYHITFVATDDTTIDSAGNLVTYGSFSDGTDEKTIDIAAGAECPDISSIIPDPESGRTGYKFCGWLLNRTSQESSRDLYDIVTPGEPVEFAQKYADENGNVFVYAFYRGVDYSLHFDPNIDNGNGGTVTGIMENRNCTYNESVYFPKCEFQNSAAGKAGEFLAWNTSPDGTGTWYNQDSETWAPLTDKEGEEITLYAIWGARTFKVHFSKGSSEATGTMSDLSVDFGTTASLPANKYKRAGYVFAGWRIFPGDASNPYTKPDDVNPDNDPNWRIENKGDITNLTAYDFDDTGEYVWLQARWSDAGYTVQFDGNGADEGEMEEAEYLYGTKSTLPLGEFYREGYHMTGWCTDPGGLAVDSSSFYTDGGEILRLTGKKNETVVLYAQWEPNWYTVEFTDGGMGAEVDPAATTYFTLYYGEEGTYINNPYTLPGYRFAGWRSYLDYLSTDTGTDDAGDTESETGGEADDPGVVEEDESDTDTPIHAPGEKYVNLIEEHGANVYVEAIWIPSTYTVHFDGNGADEGEMGDLTIGFGDLSGLPEADYTRTGHEFAGWESADGNLYMPGEERTQDLLDPDGNIDEITLRAKWIPISYTIVYSPGLGQGSSFSQKVPYDTDFPLPTPTSFTYPGYKFTHWIDANGKEYSAGQTVRNLISIAPEGAESVQLTADWDIRDFAVEFDPNGGSGTMAPYDFGAYNSSFLMPDNEFVRTGYHFTHWTGANGKVYKPGQIVSDNLGYGMYDTFTAHAQWAPNTYYVKFDPSGGTGTMPNQEMTYDQLTALSPNSFIKASSVFIGWKCTVNGQERYLADMEKVSDLCTTENGTVTLYAQWARGSYAIAYNGNGADSGSMLSLAVGTQEIRPLSANKFSRNGYMFTGWNTKADGTGTSYAPLAPVSGLAETGQTVTLYAQWKPISFTVSFSAGRNTNATGSMPDVSCTYGRTTQIPASGFSREGYAITGWSGPYGIYGMDDDLSLVARTNGEKVELTAMWTPARYTVEFNGNGAGTGAMNPISTAYGQIFQIPECRFSREGYAFRGWNTKADGTGTSFADLESTANLSARAGETIVLYAQWAQGYYTVSFDANGGTGTMDSINAPLGREAMLPVSTMTRDGYNFTGWRVQNRKSKLVDGAYIFDLIGEPGGEVVLLAQWEPIKGYIVWSSNAAVKSNRSEHGTSTQTVTDEVWYGTEITVPGNSFLRTGYTLAGYSDVENGELVYKIGETVDATPFGNNTTPLYAIWQPNNYSVKLMNNTPLEISAEASESDKIESADSGQDNAQNGTELTEQPAGNNNAENNDENGGDSGEIVAETGAGGGASALIPEDERQELENGAIDSANSESVKNQTPDTVIDAIYDSDVILPEPEPVEGYRFTGWSTRQDGYGTTYPSGVAARNLTPQSNGEIFLYGQWESTAEPVKKEPVEDTVENYQGEPVPETGDPMEIASNRDTAQKKQDWAESNPIASAKPQSGEQQVIEQIEYVPADQNSPDGENIPGDENPLGQMGDILPAAAGLSALYLVILGIIVLIMRRRQLEE